MQPIEILGLGASAFIAGTINAVAGGGTLVTFPALLYLGTPPLVANATSTLGLFLGTSGSVFGFRRYLSAVRPVLQQLLPVSLIGGLLGSLLLTITSERLFSKLVPFLILFATLLFLAQGVIKQGVSRIGIPESDRTSRVSGRWMLFYFWVALYGGYFGAGIGILMLATFGWLGLKNIHEMNALKTVLGCLINCVATVWFIFAGLVDWRKAAVLTLGAIAGYYLGSRFSQRIPQTAVKRIVVAIGFGIAAMTFYKEFW